MFVLFLLVFDLLFVLFRIALWPSAGKHRPLGFSLVFFFLIFNAVSVVRVLFPFSVWGRVWNSIVAVLDHCLFIYFRCNNAAEKGIYLHNSLCRNRFHNYIFQGNCYTQNQSINKDNFQRFHSFETVIG